MSTQFRDLRIGDKFRFTNEGNVFTKVSARKYKHIWTTSLIDSIKTFVERVK